MKQATLALIISYIGWLPAAVGCLSYTYRLQPVPVAHHMAFAWRTDTEQYDYKNIKAIACTHECKVTDLDATGFCRQCRHFGRRNSTSNALDGRFIMQQLENLKSRNSQ